MGISFPELQTIILAAVILFVTGFLTKAGEATWDWLKAEFAKRRSQE